MELEEDKISFAAIKQYVFLLKNDINELNILEFKTLKGWLVYTLSLGITLCLPGVFTLFITGFLSENIPADLLVSLPFIPFIFILPLALSLTFFNNYRKPKKLRRKILQALNRYEWNGPIQQIGSTQFVCMKQNFLFRTEARSYKNKKGLEKWIVYMIVPYYLPVDESEEEEYIKNIDIYLDGKSIFLIQTDMAYFGVPVKVFPKLDLHKDIEQLLYIMQRLRLHPCTYYNPVDILDKVPISLEILALSTFEKEIDQRCLDWANSMLESGFINENMKSFANQTLLPENQMKLKEQMKSLIREFNLDISREHVLDNYIRFLLLKERLAEISVLETIQSLSELYLSSGSSDLISFDLLYKAKIALDETGEQHFWAGSALSLDNVDSYIISYLQAYLVNGK